MKKVIILIVLSMMSLPSVVYAGPALTLNTRIKEFGPVKQGTQIKFDFLLTNIGDEDVIVEKLQPN